MSNPRFLLCDTGPLIQLFLTKDILKRLLPLRLLRDSYGIQAAIVDEVEAEVSQHSVFLNQFDGDLKKGLQAGLITKLDDAAIVTTGVQEQNLRAVKAELQSKGKANHKFVQRGEAYTFAAASTLGQIALSDDRDAIRILHIKGRDLPATILRFFDLVAFCHQVGELMDNQCDKIRQALLDCDEYVFEFKNKSFESGMATYAPRIQDQDLARIGAVANPMCLPCEETCFVKKMGTSQSPA